MRLLAIRHIFARHPTRQKGVIHANEFHGVYSPTAKNNAPMPNQHRAWAVLSYCLRVGATHSAGMCAVKKLTCASNSFAKPVTTLAVV